MVTSSPPSYEMSLEREFKSWVMGGFRVHVPSIVRNGGRRKGEGEKILDEDEGMMRELEMTVGIVESKACG